MKALRPAAISLFLACSAATGAMAAKIEKIEPASPTATLEGGKATVKFTITGSSEAVDNCGFWVEYGDGDSPDTRILNKGEGLFPRVMEHTFTKPGSFSVKVKGQRVKTIFGCNGEASTTVSIVAPAGAKASGTSAQVAAAPACPGGWQLQARSVDRKTGAYACGPKMPEKKIECGKGLAYYESGSAIGCRKTK